MNQATVGAALETFFAVLPVTPKESVRAQRSEIVQCDHKRYFEILEPRISNIWKCVVHVYDVGLENIKFLLNTSVSTKSAR